MSNLVSVEPIQQVKQYDCKANIHVAVPCPSIVCTYNSFMGGIDQHNYQVSLYRYIIWSRCWHMYLIYHAIFICIVNVWNIHRCQSYQLKERPLKLRAFIARLSESLISAGKVPRGRPTSLPSPPVKKRKIVPSHPQGDVRKDGVGHLPLVMSN